MRKFVLALALFSAPFVWAAPKQVVISVKGMVCSFCAQGITKKLKSEDGVEKVNISLKEHKVVVDLKEGKDVSDEKLKAALTDSGYTVEKIERK